MVTQIFTCKMFASNEVTFLLKRYFIILYPTIIHYMLHFVCFVCFRISATLPQTNIAPENRPSQKETIVFQPSIFSCYVSFREGTSYSPAFSFIGAQAAKGKGKLVCALLRMLWPKGSDGMPPARRDIDGLSGKWWEGPLGMGDL